MIRLIYLLFAIFLTATPASSGQLYWWVDENRTYWITDYPPPETGRMLRSAEYREITAEEIRLHEAERELSRLKNDANEQKQRYEQQKKDLDAAAKKARQQREDREGAIRDEAARREREIAAERRELARRNIEDRVAEKERYSHEERNARDEYWRLYWREKAQRADRDIESSRKVLNE